MLIETSSLCVDIISSHIESAALSRLIAHVDCCYSVATAKQTGLFVVRVIMFC
jgi:hypothetical protein